MNSKKKVIITYGLYAVDIFCVLASFLLSTFLRFHNFRDMGDKTSHFIVCLFFVLFATVYTFVVPWHNLFLNRTKKGELWHIVKMNFFMVVLTQPVMYFLKWADSFSRVVMIIFPIIDTVMIFIMHMLFMQVMKIYYSSDLSRTKVLVITEEALKDEVIRHLDEHLDMSYQLVNTVYTENINDSFYEEAMLMAVDEVFIYAPSTSRTRIYDVIRFFDEMGVVCDYCVEFPDITARRSHVNTFGGYSVMTFTHFDKSYKRLLLKRLTDILGGIIGGAITLILTPFIALAIKIDSPGPVFFKQNRVGRNGRRFKMLKFRSMYIDAEDRKKELLKDSEVTGLMFKMENDPRITKVGRFIRKTSIDELPQFFNIIKGDMSLVGTRPPTVDEFEQYNQYYRRRLSMTPGLTGLWQVSGRSDIDNFDDVVKLDLEYIDSWSLGLDIRILLKTFKVVFTGRGSK